MSADPAKRPDQVTASFAYHYCKLVMSHFGMFSWEQRCVRVCIMYICVVCACVCMSACLCSTLWGTIITLSHSNISNLSFIASCVQILHLDLT